MRPQEIEIWARDVVDTVLVGQKVEDSRVELKRAWIEPAKAAERLGGHANASRGDTLLWIIGADDDEGILQDVDPTEKGEWFRKVEKCFDGFAPRLVADLHFKVNDFSLVALCFDPSTEAPFVVKSSKGGFPEYIVPWREGTTLRAARRENLLRLLVPKRGILSLLKELDFNRAVASTGFGGIFREDKFFTAHQNGLLDTFPEDLKNRLVKLYVHIGSVNMYVRSEFQLSGNPEARTNLKRELNLQFPDFHKELNKLYELLDNLLRK